jgi:DNA-binding MarR family transcriptional regulator
MPRDPHTTELMVLNYINEHSDATQRELSAHVGLSLGAINLLLKKMVKKGLIKIDRLQTNSVKYFITPAGIASKMERTYGYVVRTYNEINRLRDRIVTVANAVAKTSKANHIIFYGKKDELLEMIVDLHKTKSFAVSTSLHKEIYTLNKELEYQHEAIVVVGSHDEETLLDEHLIEYVNIIRLLVI